MLLSSRTFLTLLLNVTAARIAAPALHRCRVEKGIAQLLKQAIGYAQSPAIPVRSAVAQQNIRATDVPYCEAYERIVVPPFLLSRSSARP